MKIIIQQQRMLIPGMKICAAADGCARVRYNINSVGGGKILLETLRAAYV